MTSKLMTHPRPKATHVSIFELTTRPLSTRITFCSMICASGIE